MLICVDSEQKEANGSPGHDYRVARDGDSRLQGAKGVEDEVTLQSVCPRRRLAAALGRN